MEENVIYDYENVRVTESALVVDKTSYPIAEISDVRRQFIQARRAYAIFYGLLGSFLAVVGVAMALEKDGSAWGWVLAAGGALMALKGFGTAWGNLPMYCVTVTLPNGQKNVLVDPSGKTSRIDEVVDAVKKAMADHADNSAR